MAAPIIKLVIEDEYIDGTPLGVLSLEGDWSQKVFSEEDTFAIGEILGAAVVIQEPHDGSCNYDEEAARV